jgi:multiple sugar transport system substrate-binding protein
MRRAVLVTALIAAALVATVGAMARSYAPSAKGGPVKLTVWVGWSARELSEFKKVVAEYDQSHPNVTVNVVGSINDDKITAAIRSGNAPDVVSSFTSANVGVYCGTGAWVDLAPFLKKDKVDLNTMPAATRYYTQFNGKRCALPLLADVFGLYYNKALFAKAGIKAPPKTLSELAADAKKLTQKNPDGSIKVAGYVPLSGFYVGNTGDLSAYSAVVGGKYFTGDGKSSLSRDPAWTRLLNWQKSLIDWYGYKNLVKFTTGAGQEFSASNAFEAGKVAMLLDGEWRVAFLAAEHPELKYGTAPMAVDDAHPELYGAGYINGTIIGIPKGGHNVDQAWDLVKYLTTNTHALAKFSNGIRNVPSTVASSKSKELKPDPNFATFLKIFTNPHSATVPITAAGTQYGTLITSFSQKWSAGKVKDLKAGLAKLDKDIDAQLAQAKKGGGGGVP